MEDRAATLPLPPWKQTENNQQQQSLTNVLTTASQFTTILILTSTHMKGNYMIMIWRSGQQGGRVSS